MNDNTSAGPAPVCSPPPAAAVPWHGQLLEAIRSLENNPERCGLAPESAWYPGEVRQLLHGKKRGVYRVLFEVRGDTGIDVGSQGAAGIEIEMTNRVQQLSGTVIDANGAALKDYMVGVFSQDRTRWKAPLNRYFYGCLLVA